jgi:hypothetical protein
MGAFRHDGAVDINSKVVMKPVYALSAAGMQRLRSYTRLYPDEPGRTPIPTARSIQMRRQAPSGRLNMRASHRVEVRFRRTVLFHSSILPAEPGKAPSFCAKRSWKTLRESRGRDAIPVRDAWPVHRLAGALRAGAEQWRRTSPYGLRSRRRRGQRRWIRWPRSPRNVACRRSQPWRAPHDQV